MSINAGVLTDSELCDRRGYWGHQFEPNRLHPTEILRRALAGALVDTEREDRGELAGELVMGLAADRGLDMRAGYNKYDVAVHYAALADILTTYLLKLPGGPWTRPLPRVGVNLTWEPMCLLRGQELTRIVLVDHWSDERALSESRSWYTLGEMAAYRLPMTIHVILLGASVNGRRHSYWSKGLLHPRNFSSLRFKKKAQKIDGFKQTFIPVWREEYDQISREGWLEAMEADGVFPDLTRKLHIEALSAERVQEVRSMIERKTEKLYKILDVPDPSYSSCDFPRPCVFRKICFASRRETVAGSGWYQRRADV